MDYVVLANQPHMDLFEETCMVWGNGRCAQLEKEMCVDCWDHHCLHSLLP